MKKPTSRELALEFFRHGSNAFLIVFLVSLLVSLLRRGAGPESVGWTVLGLGIFFLTEYAAHRFQLHAPPAASEFTKKLQHRLHYDHHIEPNRLDLLFIPVWYLVPSIVLYAAVYFKLTGDWTTVQALLFGNLLGLFYYEYVHFIAHVPVTPKTAWGRYMKKYHLWHHYKNENFWYGVTNPIFDYLFGTYRDQNRAEKSGTTRSLHVKE